MNETWKDFLAARAPLPAAHPQQARAFVCDLPDEGLLAFRGPDAEAFLQGQMSCDVTALPPGSWLPGSYNTPKGRALATLLLWRGDDGFLARLPAEIAEPVRKRLSMYVLRSKVTCEAVTERFVCLGLGDAPQSEVLRALGVVPPDRARAAIPAVRLGGSAGPVADWMLSLPGDRHEFLFSSLHAAQDAWALLEAHCPAAPPPAWTLRAIRAGIADVVAATQDQFVPQMLNLDLLGAVSFTKGCYPGQEIVARTHYLGRAARRMHRARAAAAAARAGEALFCPALPGQAVGMVAAAAPVPEGGVELLAVLQDAYAGRDDVTVASPDGPRLDWLPLPYAVPTQASAG